MQVERQSERRETLGYWPAEDTDNGSAVRLLTNISEEGIQMHSRHSFPEGEVLTLRIKAHATPSRTSYIALVVENVWCRASGVPGLYHAGFKVLDMSNKARKDLKTLLQSFSYPAPGAGRQEA